MDKTLEFVLAVFVWFGGSGAIAAAIALVIDLFKRFGLVKDGDAGKWSAALNLLGLTAFTVFFLFNPNVAFAEVDESLRLVMQVVGIVLALVLQLRTTPAVHNEGTWYAIPGFYSFDRSDD
jgi:hypothetical protein